MLTETADPPRQIHMDGRPLPKNPDPTHMDVEITFNDPKYYTQPFTLKTGLRLMPDSDLLEYVCVENEKDRAHLGK